MSTPRVDPFGDLSDFSTAPAATPAKPVQKDQIDRIAAENNFPSRQAMRPANTAAHKPVRRYTTGRNQQINIKATAATIERLYAIADDKHIPLGEVLELALLALERAEAASGKGG